MKRFFLWCVVLYLRFFARIALFVAKPRVIGVAGSVGKSSAREILYAALRDNNSVKNIYGNSETGIPLGLLGIKPAGYDILSWISMLISVPFRILYLRGAKWIIVEMGIDEPYPPRNMDYLLSIVSPEIAISLNVSATHTLQFEELFREKRYSDVPKSRRHEFLIEKIAEDDCGIITRSGCKVGIYNADDSYVKSQIEKYKHLKNTELLSFGKHGDISYGEYSVSLEGTTFNFLVSGEEIRLRLLGYVLPEEYQETIGACLLAVRSCGVSIDKAVSSLEKHFRLPPGRSSIFSGINDSIIIDSSYNASQSSTVAFLELVKRLKKTTGRPVSFLFGDMRELGEEAEGEHVAVADKMVGVVDYLYLVGPLTQKYVLPKFENNRSINVMWFQNSLDAGEYLSENLLEKTILLVKGSQNTIFLEEAIKPLLKSDKDTEALCRQDGYWMDIKSASLSL